MKWEVTYRGNDGALTSAIVEAGDRQELFKKLSGKGISAIKVKERHVKPHDAKRRKSLAISGLVGCSIIFLIFIAIILCSRKTPDRLEADAPLDKKDNQHTSVILAPSPQQPQRTRVEAAKEDSKPLTEHERKIAEIKKKIKENPQRMPDTNSVFRTSLEQTLALMFTTELGKPPFPFPPLSAKDRDRITEILISDNPVTIYDSEMVVFQKEMVAQVKKEMRKFIKEGGDPQKFIDYYQNELRVAAQERSLAVTESRKIMKESPELYKDFVETVNKRFEEKGIKQIPLLPLTDD